MGTPLSSLKILDFTTLLPGPTATMMLGDMGADIIKVEAPQRPDMMRMMPPFKEGTSAAHGYLNRSKRSLALNLKSEEGRKVVKRLVSHYDIVMEQFRPGVMERLGLGYGDLRKVNPRVIYCSVSGYGQTGPFRERAGHDLNYLSVAGVMAYNGRGESGPAPMGLQVADIAGGAYHSVMGILAAVISRAETGEGQHVDISMTDAAFSMHSLTAPAFFCDGSEPGLENTVFNGGTAYDCYETKDGRHFSMAGIEPHFFARTCDALGHPELKEHALSLDPEVQRNLKEKIAAAMKEKTFGEWQVIFADLDACIEPVLTLKEACDHPQIKAREMIVEVPSKEGEESQLACPIKFSHTPLTYRFSGAALGEHSEEILTSAGYGEDEIRALRESGVIL